jgi:hypothetical protein
MMRWQRLGSSGKPCSSPIVSGRIGGPTPAQSRGRKPLLSDQDLRLAVALRLPTFRAGGHDHLKRLTLLVDGEREIRHVLFPIADPLSSVDQALSLLDRSRGRPQDQQTT